ncbi:MAG: hypothetical protein KDA88_19985 [Planctomycetaceae bacterium]|nr:hypothetical protein [Planctomycetaceae bacterium]MCB9949766.1 hypothetical protein [Planctomycetaceae bacterium]
MTSSKTTKFLFSLLVGVGCGLVLAALLVGGFVLLAIIELSSGSDAGSIELAREWRDELTAYASVQEALEADAEIEHVEFENGEWIIGRARNSHGTHEGGGTVVVCDSHGEVHGFHNSHICGEGFLTDVFACVDDAPTFYIWMSDHGFDEYDFDETNSPAE